MPVLGTRPPLLVMDLFRSHQTGPVQTCLKDNNISLSLVPGGCTGLLQPLNVSVNRPFKDILKMEIDKDIKRQDLHNEDVISNVQDPHVGHDNISDKEN